jgi:transcriptional regulator with XRE-family HTH domain
MLRTHRYKKIRMPDLMDPAIHPLVGQVFFEINRQRIALADVASSTGISLSTLDRWRTGASSPTLAQLELVAKRLDCELKMHRIYRVEIMGDEGDE